MAITIGGIVCQERVHNFKEEASLQDGFRARKGFICGWADRFTVARGLLGLSSSVTIGGAITINAPAAYPEPNIAGYCQSIEIEPLGKPTQGTNQIQWENACVWANYGVTKWAFQGVDYGGQIDPGTPFVFAEQQLSSSCEWITLPGAGCKWVTGGKALQQGGGMRISLVNMSITLHQMPYMPTLASVLYGGTINKYPYMNCYPGCLMFNGVETQQQFNADGSRTQDATYTFIFRPVRWDYQYDPAQKKWDQVTMSSDGGTTWQPVVQSIDFNYIIPTSYDAVARYPIDPKIPMWPPLW